MFILHKGILQLYNKFYNRFYAELIQTPRIEEFLNW